MKSIPSLLQEVHLFKELTEHELASIAGLAQKREYREKMLVFMQGEPLKCVYFIASGLVKTYKTDLQGKEQIVAVLQAGDMFPHAGFFRKGDYPAHAEIVKDATLIAIPIMEFEHLLLQNPKICIKLFRVMGERIVDLQNRLEEQVLHNTYEQIVMLLLRLSQTHGTKTNNEYIQLNTHFTNRELANMIGTSRETVSRTLTRLKKKGSLLIDQKGYFLINTVVLEDEQSTGGFNLP